jgi:6-phosphogluconate dehydrogenase
MADVGVIGMGAMGLNLSFLIADSGFKVLGYNRPEEPEKIGAAEKLAKEQHVENYIGCCGDIEQFVNKLLKPRKIFIEISHGSNVDEVIQKLKPHLSAGDVLVDCGNEWYEETQRRIKELGKSNIFYLGMGVSGGYQAARRGPSMSPSGSREAYESLKSLLEKIAAKSQEGEPCVSYFGEAGCGHYIKMVHNGIEQGMMSAITEAYGLMRTFGFSHEEMGKYFGQWLKTRELSKNYLIDISAKIVVYKDEKHSAGQNCSPYLLDNILDNVVQDANSSEGSGVWTIRDTTARHMPSPTMVAAHYFRLTSAQRNDRVEAAKLRHLLGTNKQMGAAVDKDKLAEDLRLAVYATMLTAFVEGFNLIVRASSDEKWNINIDEVLRIYRGGCIIQSDYITQLLRDVYRTHKDNGLLHNLFLSKTVTEELAKGLTPLRTVVLLAVEYGQPAPALSASLNNLMSSYSDALPTNMMQAQLDYFGLHRYARVDEPLPRDKELDKAKYHTEWAHPLENKSAM